MVVLLAIVRALVSVMYPLTLNTMILLQGLRISQCPGRVGVSRARDDIDCTPAPAGGVCGVPSAPGKAASWAADERRRYLLRQQRPWQEPIAWVEI